MGSRHFLTMHEAARTVGVSYATVRRMLAAGELLGVMVGGQIRVRSRSVTAWLETEKTEQSEMAESEALKPSLTLPELAAYWRISERTLRRMRSRGQVQVRRGCWAPRVPLYEIQRYEQDQAL